MEDFVEKVKNKENSQDLREMAFNVKFDELWNIRPLGDYGIYGVIMEMGYPQGFITLACFITGDASVYFSSGGGMIGGVGRESVKNASLEFVRSSPNFITQFCKREEYPYPSAGKTTFYILANGDRYFAEASTNDFKMKTHVLMPLFAAGQDVITQYRLMEQKDNKKA